MSSRITIDIQDHVAHVCMCRGDRHNALDAEQFQAIHDAGIRLRDRLDIRAIVLSGDGPSFCSGLDFPSFMQPGQDISLAFRHDEGEIANYAQRLAMVWREQAVPVIAAVHGVAYGGGMQLALGADFRVAAPGARFSLMEIEYGLIPDMAVSQTLLSLLRYDQALDLALSGRKIDAPEALAMGLVSRLDEQPLEAALQWAEQIAARSPDAVRSNKQLMRACWASNPELLELEERLQVAIMRGANYREAVSAKLAKRAPLFENCQPD